MSLTFVYHFEERQALNTKHQVETFFCFHHEIYYRSISLFFGHNEMVTQNSSDENAFDSAHTLVVSL